MGKVIDFSKAKLARESEHVEMLKLFGLENFDIAEAEMKIKAHDELEQKNYWEGYEEFIKEVNREEVKY